MPKKYQYFIVLTKNLREFQSCIHINEYFDHPITDDDIRKIEKANPLVDDWIVTNYILQKVTGTFTYQFLTQIFIAGRNSFFERIVWDFDHQITPKTIEADYGMILAIAINHEKYPHVDYVKVLFHQEIPDE